MKVRNMSGHVLAAAVVLLQSAVPDLTPRTLIRALQEWEDTPPDPLPKLMTRQDVADYLQVSVCTVMRICADGGLRYYKMNKRTVRFKRDEVEAYVDAQLADPYEPEPLP